jgi:hypothetical protein
VTEGCLEPVRERLYSGFGRIVGEVGRRFGRATFLPGEPYDGSGHLLRELVKQLAQVLVGIDNP